MKNIVFCFALAAALVACAPAAATPNTSVPASAVPSAAALPSTETPTLTPAATPMSTATPASTCDQLTALGKPGLYVISVQPIPDLVWDRTPRQFIVDICSTLAGATPDGSRFVVFIYFPGEARPRGQTAELPVRLDPGLHEITLAAWIPGLQNHISACNVQPPVQVSVAYTFPPSLNIFHPISFADGEDRMTFTVKCGGTFP